MRTDGEREGGRRGTGREDGGGKGGGRRRGVRAKVGEEGVRVHRREDEGGVGRGPPDSLVCRNFGRYSPGGMWCMSDILSLCGILCYYPPLGWHIAF